MNFWLQNNMQNMFVILMNSVKIWTSIAYKKKNCDYFIFDIF